MCWEWRWQRIRASGGTLPSSEILCSKNQAVRRAVGYKKEGGEVRG